MIPGGAKKPSNANLPPICQPSQGSSVVRACFQLGYERWVLCQRLAEFGGSGFDDEPDAEAVADCCSRLHNDLLVLQPDANNLRLGRLADLLKQIRQSLHEFREAGRNYATERDAKRGTLLCSDDDVAGFLLWQTEPDVTLRDIATLRRFQKRAHKPDEVFRSINAQSRERTRYCVLRKEARANAVEMNSLPRSFNEGVFAVVKELLPGDSLEERFFLLGNHLGQAQWQNWLPGTLRDTIKILADLWNHLVACGVSELGDPRKWTLYSAVREGLGDQPWCRWLDARYVDLASQIKDYLRPSRPLTPNGVSGASLVKVLNQAEGGIVKASANGNEANPTEEWLKVTDAARRLMKRRPKIETLGSAKATVSKAAKSEKFTTNRKTRHDLRIEPNSFEAWLSSCVDKDDAAEDAGH